MQTEGFYSIIPHTVLFDRDLSPGAKLLFCYITSLQNNLGYAYATNKHMGDKFEVAEWSISQWIAQLRERGYLEVVIEDNYQRKIYLTNKVYSTKQATFTKESQSNEECEKPNGVCEKTQGGIGKITRGVCEKPKDNSIREKYNKIRERETMKIPTIDQVKEHGQTIDLSLDESEKFFWHHEAKGWMMGKTKMKNWKAGMQTWKRNAAKWSKPDEPIQYRCLDNYAAELAAGKA